MYAMRGRGECRVVARSRYIPASRTSTGSWKTAFEREHSSRMSAGEALRQASGATGSRTSFATARSRPRAAPWTRPPAASTSAPRLRFPLSPPRRTRRHSRERRHARQVQHQFGDSRGGLRHQRRVTPAATTWTGSSPGAAPWRRAACSTWRPAAATPRSPSPASRASVTAFDLTEPMLHAARGLLASAAPPRRVRGRRRGDPALRATAPSTSSPVASPPITLPTWPRAVREVRARAAAGRLLAVQDILGHDDAEPPRSSPRSSAAAIPRTSAPTGPSSGRRSCARPGSR